MKDKNQNCANKSQSSFTSTEEPWSSRQAAQNVLKWIWTRDFLLVVILELTPTIFATVIDDEITEKL